MDNINIPSRSDLCEKSSCGRITRDNDVYDYEKNREEARKGIVYSCRHMLFVLLHYYFDCDDLLNI